ncbi:MAG: hypothetical protein M1823_003031 [Watsoniomyces obsoletus]|nr:MAG: hypothetical protein M1823_003031 [Watsoniomyces obsoletus]
MTGVDIIQCVSTWSINVMRFAQQIPMPILLLIITIGSLALIALFYLVLCVIAPVPRAPLASEKRYVTVDPNADVTPPRSLPCWLDEWTTRREATRGRPTPQAGIESEKDIDEAIEPPEVFLSVVVPAYNEESRLPAMLDEAVAYLRREEHFKDFREMVNGDVHASSSSKANGVAKRGRQQQHQQHPQQQQKEPQGWEILVISDGSTDDTVDVALSLAGARGRNHRPRQPDTSGSSPPAKLDGLDTSKGTVRVVSLERNRGKGGAVTHGMRHVRGQYVLFADADGASTFSDLSKLMATCRSIADDRGRAIAIGSRAHLVGSEAVVKRSLLRNLLMHSFHLLLRLLTPPATALIKDTQCGFKLFSRPSLPYIIPYMHSDGWIFDVEMLMLAEAAGIPVQEVAVGWKEVGGSKLNVIWDSLGMAWGLAVLRAAWGMGVYRRR